MTIDSKPRQGLFQQAPRRPGERLVRLALRSCSYLAVAAAGWIFLHIAIRGAPVLFQATPPFINLEFLTGYPQTLHVYQPIELVAQVDKALQAVQSSEFEIAPSAPDLSEQMAQLKALQRQLKDESLLYSDQALRQLPEAPDDARYVYASYAYSAGGIGTAVIGTVLLVVGALAISLFLGIASAIYLSEYSRPGLMLQFIRLSVLNLSGVPSIVFGLFGFGFFVLFFGWGVSLLAGWLTLALVALPVVIASTEQALRAVPQSYRLGPLGLGASKWTMIRTNVLPQALPEILTNSILSIARVAGETAAILFTAAFALREKLPWEGLEAPSDIVFQGVMALPYHVYVLCAKLPQNEYTKDMQYGTVFVLLLLIGACAFASIYLRQRIRSKATL